MKRFLISLISIVSIYSYAYDFEYDGLYYTISSVSEKTVLLASPPDQDDFPDNLVIPEIVEYNGKILSVIGFDYNVFEEKHNFSTISIPQTVISIDDEIFNMCCNLSEVRFEDGENNLECGSGSVYKSSYGTEIGRYSLFESCPLEKAYVGRNITTTPYRSNQQYYPPFRANKTLKHVEISGYCTNIPAYFFSDCNAIENLILHTNINCICDDAFNGCSSLLSLTLPNSLHTIGYRSFRGCQSLENITIPENVKAIGNYAFSSCYNVKKIYILGCPELNEGAFGNPIEDNPKAEVYVYSNTPPSIKKHNSYDCFSRNTYLNKLFVPQGTKSLYENATVWKEFWEIIEMNETPNNKCNTPTIEFLDKKLCITSDTKNSTCFYKIECKDVTDFTEFTDNIELNAIYDIYAYAIAEGFIQSDMVKYTLIFSLDYTEISNNINSLVISAKPIIINNHNECLKISGINDTLLYYYDINGIKLGESRVIDGNTVFHYPSMHEGIIIIKGNKTSLKYKL